MLASLYVQNFMSHKSVNIEFSEGVNVFVGQSDSGKSALLQAMDWCINNRPGGDAFRSWWGGDTMVQLEFVSGLQITRMRSDKENCYIIADPEGNEEKFTALGKGGVPAEVKEAMNFSEFSFLSQMASPFMLSMSGGEAARFLNRTVDLEVIDIAQMNIKRMKKEASDSCDFHTKELEIKKAGLGKYSNLEQLEDRLKRLEIFDGKIKCAEREARGIDSLLTDIAQTVVVMDKAAVFVSQKALADSLVTQTELIREREAEATAIKTAEQYLVALNRSLRRERVLCSFKGRTEDLTATSRELQIRSDKVGNLFVLTGNVLAAQRKIDFLRADVSALKEKLPDVCPLCGVPFDRDPVKNFSKTQ